MKLSKIVVVFIVIAIVFNSFVLLRSFDIISLPGEVSGLDLARAGTDAMLSYLNNYAEVLNVSDSSVVKESIGLLQYKIHTAKTEEELAQIIINESRSVQETIVREHEDYRNREILNIISADPNLANADSSENIVVWGESGEGIQVNDSGNILSEETIDKIKNSEELPTIFSEVAVNVIDGTPRIMSSRRLYDRLDSLETEVVNLQQKLIEVETKAGFQKLVGEGIRIKLYDAEGGYLENEIVHDVDVRDILNELFASGAQGASVGNQRIITTSSIRCIGPVILVNYEPIAVDPVIIDVVGDSDKLTSGLEVIKNTLEPIKGISIEIEQIESITLPEYSRNNT
ncbi:MAG: DUF881 domain-containing protein [Clostridia bacterium]